MRLGDLFKDAWVAVPLGADDLGSALADIFARMQREGIVGEERGQKLARDLAFGSQGEVVRVNEEVVIVLGVLEALEGPSVTVGAAPEPFAVTAEGLPEPGKARAVVLVLAPGSLSGLKQQMVPAIVRALQDRSLTGRLVEAGSAAEIRGLDGLMDAEFVQKLLVEDALQPVKYRVYPDTPLAEVTDLMVRRALPAVPVVGERYEVLGILTAADALRHLLRKGRARAEEEDEAREEKGVPRARDVMTRSVLCVSEDQSLADAGNMMVNKDVSQLPVVREGELIGFVTRASILAALYGPVQDEEHPELRAESEPASTDNQGQDS